MIRFFFSSPATIRSIATVKSSSVTRSPSRRVTSVAASFTRLARSAPVKPGVSAAISSSATLAASVTLRTWTARMARRPAQSGRSTRICRSKRPARSRAGSSTSGRFVAASSTTPVEESNPSSSESSWFKICSFSSCPPPSGLRPRARPSASSSSMKMMQGADLRAWSNRSRTRAAPTPTNISTNSEPFIRKNGTSASPATARANRVLPVPGGPTSRTPLGMRAPSRPCAAGAFRKATISLNSAFASSTPATSSKPTPVSFSTRTLPLFLPRESMPPAPNRSAARRMTKSQIAAKARIGRIQERISRKNVFSVPPAKSTP